MIRVFVVDYHPALRLGLQTFLDGEPGFVYAGGCGPDEEALWPLLRRVRPDVALLDHGPPSCDGLQLCHRIKQRIPTLKVTIFSAYARDDLMLPARLAGADGLINKRTGGPELFESLRRIGRGECLVGESPPTVLRETLAHIPAADSALTNLLLDGTPEAQVAQALGTTVHDLHHEVQRILGALPNTRAGTVVAERHVADQHIAVMPQAGHRGPTRPKRFGTGRTSSSA
jgi:DNA-binding NarL/FixJ family response regulator